MSHDPAAILHITPIFAAFEFPTLADARAAFANVQSSDAQGIGSWAMLDPLTNTFIVALLGEDQANVDHVARIVMASPNCRDNFVLDQSMMKILQHRRYDPLLEAIAKGEKVVSTVTSWAAEGGVRMGIDGKEQR